MSALQTERLQGYMSRLKLAQMPMVLDQIAEEAAAKELGYLDFLERLLEEEAQAKHSRNVTLKTQLARFPYVKRLDAFDFSFQPSLDAKRIRELASLRCLADRANVLFLGPPGVGKTHLAIALGLEAITQGYGVVFTTLAGLLGSLERAKTANRLDERLKALGQPKLLILDRSAMSPWTVGAPPASSRSSATGMSGARLSSRATRAMAMGGRSSRIRSSPARSWIGCCITRPPSSSRAQATGSRRSARPGLPCPLKPRSLLPTKTHDPGEYSSDANWGIFK